MVMRIILLILYLRQTYCAISIEETVVTDEEKAAGYSCKSYNEKLGLMKEGEEKTQYDPQLCLHAVCEGGSITVSSCSYMESSECQLVTDLSKPYPECCPQIAC